MTSPGTNCHSQHLRLPRILPMILLGVSLLTLGGCASLMKQLVNLGAYTAAEAGQTPQSAGDGTDGGGTGSGAAGDGDSSTGATQDTTSGDPAGGGDGSDGTVQDALISGLSPEGPADEMRLFRVTEEYWIATPWFGVSSIIVMVKRLPSDSYIVVEPDSLLQRSMGNARRVVERLPPNYRQQKFRVGIVFHMGDVPPFVSPERYGNPEEYY